MSFPVQSGRIDLLLIALAEQACKKYIDPALPIPVWSEGLARDLAQRVQRAGVPNTPVTHIQVGHLHIPLGVAKWLAEATGILPKQIGGPES